MPKSQMRLMWPLVWVLLLAVVGWAPDTAASDPAEARSFDQGLLFSVAPPDDSGPHSWLFGTIHSSDPRVLSLPKAVEDAFAAADVLVLEVVPDPGAMARSTALMRLSGGRNLQQVLPPDLYQRAVLAVASVGVPATAVDGMKPWALAILLSLPPGRAGDVLDLMLYRRALSAGKQVLGLETMTEQLSVFDGLSDSDQVVLLEEAVDGRPQLPALSEQLLLAYLGRDLGALLALEQTQLVRGDQALAARLREALIDARNREMADRLISLLGQRSHFVAVGALHLPGQGGLLERLRDAAFVIERVY
jgi:uncharacterized protein YbaP (TraB family)